MLAVLGEVSRIHGLFRRTGKDGQKFFKLSPLNRLRLFELAFT